MRWKTVTLGIIFTILSGISLVDRSQAQDTVSIDLFYQELSPYGQWTPHVEFGYIWQPYEVGPEWKPYTDGRWAWSDQGWIWISYEPWGWATYHYGRWVFDDYQGWIWIPGTTWAPAWVSWHQSPEYIGWSPLPPDRGFFIEIGFVFNSFKTNYYKPYHYKHHHKKHRYYHEYYQNPHNYRPPARHCVFLPYNNFGHHKHAGKAAVPPPHYDIVLRNSKNVTNIQRINNRVINYGPDKNLIEKRSNRKLVRHNIVDRNNATLIGKKKVNIVKGNSYNVYRPKIERGNKNPYITNRNQINNSSPRNNYANSVSRNQTQLNKSSQDININSKHRNQTRIAEPHKKTGFSKGNNRGNSGIKNEKVYKQNQKSNINKNNYYKTPDRYNKYGYKNQQQRNLGQVQPKVKTKTHSVKGNKASINKQNFNKNKNPGYKNTLSNTYSSSQYGRNSGSYNQPNQKTIKKSANKNYSKKHKQVSRNKSNVSQRSFYKPKTSTTPSSRKPTLTKR